MEQEIKAKPEDLALNLEDLEKTELSELDIGVAKYTDPSYEAEGKKRLHELAMKIEALAKESEITLAKIFQDAAREKGLMNKLASFLRGVKDKMTQTGSSTHNSISFLTATIRVLEGYRQEIPIHISNFQNGINTLKAKKKEVMRLSKIISIKLKAIDVELTKLRKQVQEETNEQKKEELRAKEQEIVNTFQNIKRKGNKSLKDLENLNNVTELFLEMKGGYEILLEQVANLLTELKRHKKILETIGPATAEVRRVVLTLDKFTNLVSEYRRRDNEEVRLTTRAIVEITPAIANMERSWYNEKTIEIVKKNVKDAKKGFEEHYGTDITKLEDYDSEGNPKNKKKPKANLEDLGATE